MRNRRGVGDLSNANASGLDRADRAFAAGAGALHTHFTLVHALGHGDTGGVLRDHRRGESGRLAAALESGLACRAPGNDSAARIRDGDLSIVERAADERDAGGNGLAGTLLGDGLALGGSALGPLATVWVWPE